MAKPKKPKPDETEAYARSTDPDTSHDAAARARTSRLEMRVYSVLLEHRGVFMTALEVAREMKTHAWSISPRFEPLFRKGYVEKSKKLGVNSNGNPRMMLAWKAIPRKPVQLILL